MTMISSLLRLGRRQLHTIVSREIIKPSSPTPSHLKTHNLSVLDQLATSRSMPMVAFYPNTDDISRSPHDKKILDLKNSLSQTLTKYYPFAGRLAKIAPSYVDCNDDGAEFLEASVGSTLSDFLQDSHHEDLDQFFRYPQIWSNNPNKGHDDQSDKVIPLAVQVNHFECGGVAVAVSLSHKIADGSSLVHFLNDWAKMTRFCSSNQKQDFPIIDPRFVPFQNINMNFDGTLLVSNDCIPTSFVFPTSKINDLKTKVKSMAAESGQPITNPTRFEVLTWLLLKCSVAAATKNNSGTFKPPSFGYMANIRSKITEPLPENTIGNFVHFMGVPTTNEGAIMKPESFIGELKKQKILQAQGLTDIQNVLGHFLEAISRNTVEELRSKFDETYMCSSICRYPIYEIDFGWGNPVKTTIGGKIKKNSFVLMDAPNEDGIEALVCLGKQEMDIIQTDPELLQFC